MYRKFDAEYSYRYYMKTFLKICKDSLTNVIQIKGMKVCVFSTWLHTHTHTHQSGSATWQVNPSSTQEVSTYHSQDGIQEDVQLHDGGVGVVQNGPGQPKHAVICSQTQVVQDVLVAAHFLRGRSGCCTLKWSEIEALIYCFSRTFAFCLVCSLRVISLMFCVHFLKTDVMKRQLGEGLLDFWSIWSNYFYIFPSL